MNRLQLRRVIANTKAKLVLFMHKVCKFFKIQVYYESHYGIKVLNRKPDRSLYIEQTILINPAHVLLFADGLKDSYTLTRRSIIDSPHYFLVKGVLEKSYSLCEDYCERESKGFLDGRFPLVVNKKTVEMHVRCTQRNMALLENDNYSAPKVTFFEGIYYALDGKHRLAMAAFLGKKINCEVVSLKEILSSEYVLSICHKMSKSPQRYSCNLELLSSMEKSIHV